MSTFYRIAYRLGFTPWESGLAQPSVATQITAMFEREERERGEPYGRALDLGCGSGIHAVALARRGWQVTGIDMVPKALDRARVRARDAGVEIAFHEGDVAALDAAGIVHRYDLVLDFGTVHGLAPEQREAVGRQVGALTDSGATLLMLAFAPGHRGPLPRGLSRVDVEATWPGWRITDEVAQDAHLPWLLRKVGADPRWYRLRRTGV